MAAKQRYFSDEDHIGKTRAALKRLSFARQREYLLFWFSGNFEDPVNETPYESAEGGYQYIWGGPYDAHEELSSEFGEIVSEKLIADVVAEVESDGITAWAPGHSHPNMRQRDIEAAADDDERWQDHPRVRQSAGVTTSFFTAGKTVGSPLQQRAYITPRFPSGVGASVLQTLDPAIQRETVLWWFFLNFEPFDIVAHGDPNAGFGRGSTPHGAFGESFGHPFGQQIPSYEVLYEEFSGVISGETVAQIADSLPGIWIPKNTLLSPQASFVSSRSEALAALVPIFGALSDILTKLPLTQAHGKIGHNNPPESIPLTHVERDDVVSDLSEAKEVAASNVDDASEKVITIWARIDPKLKILGDWTFERINDFAVEANKEAAKTVGKWAPHYLFIKLVGLPALATIAKHLITAF